MAYLTPLAREAVPELETTFALTEGFLGFLPNDVLTMARLPGPTRAFMEFCIAIYQSASLPQPLLHLVGMMASSAAGCRYCTAHTANKAQEDGVAAEKVAALWDYETSPLFSEGERAALAFAQRAGHAPSLVTATDYDALRAHFSDTEITELLFVICQFGFWNRWNDSVATLLEPGPRDFAKAALAPTHWTQDKHS